MIRKRKFSKHFDLVHGIMFNNYPSEYPKTMGVPGVFVKKINRRVHLKNGTGGEMDSAYIADPDYEILFEQVAIALEHQSMPVNDSKLSKFGDYDIQLVADANLPTFLVVASHLNEKESRNLLVRSPSDITKLYFLDLGEENITQRLNNVTKIINNNQHLTTEDALNLGVIVLFAPRKFSCEITEKVVNLYSKIVNSLDSKMEETLYLVLTIMIDAYFDDENKYQELMNMMNKNTSEETIQQSETQRYLLEELEYTKEDLTIANGKLQEKDKTIKEVNGKLQEKDKTIKEVNGKLQEKERFIKEVNGKLAKLEAENQMLKKRSYGK